MLITNEIPPTTPKYLDIREYLNLVSRKFTLHAPSVYPVNLTRPSYELRCPSSAPRRALSTRFMNCTLWICRRVLAYDGFVSTPRAIYRRRTERDGKRETSERERDSFQLLFQHPPLEYLDEEWLSYPSRSSQYYLPGNTRKKLTAGICRASLGDREIYINCTARSS